MLPTIARISPVFGLIATMDGVVGVALRQVRLVGCGDLFQLGLEVEVQRGVDLQAALVQHRGAVLLLDQVADVHRPSAAPGGRLGGLIPQLGLLAAFRPRPR